MRLGIIGTGRIAKRFVKEAHYVSGLSLNCVYNPRLKSAERFAQEMGIESATNDFTLFISKVDAVYIASPHGTHYDYAKMALSVGMNVLLEKPMVLSRSQAEELFTLARENNLVLMEAIKTAYAPGFIKLMELTKSGEIGEIIDVEACFTKLTGDEGREFQDVDFGGSFTELGSYTLLPIAKLFGTDFKSLSFESIPFTNGLDGYTKAYLRYEKGMATAKTGLKVKSEGELIISGTKGYIKVKAPWWKTTEFEVCFEDMSKNYLVNEPFEGDGLRYELEEFVRKSESGNRANTHLSVGESIFIAGVMETFLNTVR